MSVTTGSTVCSSEQRKLVLGKLLKSGGAGSVYLMPQSPLQVAKIYHDSANRAEYEHKVAAMLELSPHLPDLIENNRHYVQIAWPQALLRDERGHFLGFLMPTVDVQATSELECILQERQARAAHLPTGLGAKVTLAANLAVVIAALHDQGHHVIDLKPVNLRFYPQGLYMAMLDCDGFSIQGRGERFAADQITPDYLAPEFQGKDLPAGAETQQDLFALAVVIFQLLNFGIHPFTGKPNSDHVPTDIPGRIAQRCYAYGLHPNSNLAPSPVSGHRWMPADLRLLFDRAFESAGPTRPSANEWVILLKRYALRSSQLLLVCRTNKEHQHFAGMPCAACARAALIRAALSSDAARNAVAAKVVAPPSLFHATGIRTPHFTPSAQPMRTQSMHLVPRGASQNWQHLLQTQQPTQRALWTGGIPWRFMAGVCWFLIVVMMQTCNHSPRNATQPAYVPPASAAPASVPEGQTSLLQNAMNNSVRIVADAAFSGNPAALAGAMDRLRGFAADNPAYQLERNDTETDFTAGMIALRTADRTQACDAFVHAVVDDPGSAKAWYGVGVTAPLDSDVIGALAVAEFLQPGLLDTAKTGDFPSELLSSAGIDLALLAVNQTRARLLAVKLTAAQPSESQ